MYFSCQDLISTSAINVVLAKKMKSTYFLKLYSKYEPLLRAYVRNGFHNKIYVDGKLVLIFRQCTISNLDYLLKVFFERNYLANINKKYAQIRIIVL